MNKVQQKASRKAIAAAIKISGTQESLSMSTGISQGKISRMLNGDLEATATDAVAIMNKTRVPKWDIRPDLFDKPTQAKTLDGLAPGYQQPAPSLKNIRRRMARRAAKKRA